METAECIFTLFSVTRPSLSSSPISACIIWLLSQFLSLFLDKVRNLLPPDIEIAGGQLTDFSHVSFRRSINGRPPMSSALMHSLAERQAGLPAPGMKPLRCSPYWMKHESQRALGKHPLFGTPNIAIPRTIGRASASTAK